MRVVGVIAACLVALAGVPWSAQAHVPALRSPVGDVVVLQPFDAWTTYGPGHRGVDLAASTGQEVVAPAAGVVRFAGLVAGRRWVTVDHGELRSTVGDLAAVVVAVGQPVSAGERLGTVGVAHEGVVGVHLSVRRGGAYLDPVPLLRAPARAASLVATPDGRGSGPPPPRDRVTWPRGRVV